MNLTSRRFNLQHPKKDIQGKREKPYSSPIMKESSYLPSLPLSLPFYSTCDLNFLSFSFTSTFATLYSFHSVHSLLLHPFDKSLLNFTCRRQELNSSSLFCQLHLVLTPTFSTPGRSILHFALFHVGNFRLPLFPFLAAAYSLLLTTHSTL